MCRVKGEQTCGREAAAQIVRFSASALRWLTHANDRNVLHLAYAQVTFWDKRWSVESRRGDHVRRNFEAIEKLDGHGRMYIEGNWKDIFARQNITYIRASIFGSAHCLWSLMNLLQRRLPAFVLYRNRQIAYHLHFRRPSVVHLSAPLHFAPSKSGAAQEHQGEHIASCAPRQIYIIACGGE